VGSPKVKTLQAIAVLSGDGKKQLFPHPPTLGERRETDYAHFGEEGTNPGANEKKRSLQIPDGTKREPFEKRKKKRGGVAF